MLKKIEVQLTVTVGGSSWNVDTDSFSGRILDIVWDGTISDAHANITGDPDIAVTIKETSESIWTEANVAAGKTVRPASLVQDNTGTNTTQYDYYNLVNERINLAISGITVATADVTGAFTIRYVEPDQVGGYGSRVTSVSG